ncbi:hypothetical protein [Streptomyces sp. NPDC058279]|uniref:hypothetical protein n=1 Tax=Streptomyces sp. NPDC058279 TaxID=3346418 RepID=UPI0036E51938
MAGAGGSRILLVTPGPGTAAVLLGEETGPGHVTVLCLEAGTESERADFGRAAVEAGSRGCPVDGAPRGLPAENLERALLRHLYEVAPDRVLTCDPLAGRDVAEADDADERESALALAVLDAVEEYQRETGHPVFTDCRVLDRHAWPAPVSRPRYPAPTAWAVRGTDGRVSAYLPVPGAVARWTEGAGGRWTGPQLLDAPGLLPALSVAQGPDGYPALVGLRRVRRGKEDWNVEVVVALQYQTGRPLGPWRGLANPHRGEPLLGRYVSAPVAAHDDGGTLYVFLRNGYDTLNARHQRADGSWAPWFHLGGHKAADEIVAMRTPRGRIDLIARMRDEPGVVRWYRAGPKGAWESDRGPNVHALPGSLAAAPESGALRYRYAETGELCQWGWGAYGPVGLNGPAVRGRVSAAPGVAVGGWSCTVLAAEDEQGHCVIGTHVDGRPDSGVWWSTTGQRTLIPPAVVRDRDERVVIATLGPGARLAVARQAPDEQALAFEPWLDLA